jgi:hypothetical protein
MSIRVRGGAALLAMVLAMTSLGLPAAAQVPLPVRPGPTELAAAAATQVDDAPVAPPAEVDLASVAEAAGAQVAGMTAAQWRIPTLADSFEGDPERAFAFVRDSIAFDAYPGILRGAEGTLVARAGNGWDRAILLRTLLDAMSLTSRYVTADLDDATAARVAARVLETPRTPLEDGRAVAAGQVRLDAITHRAARDYALLRGALGERVTGMHALVPDDLIPDTRQHAWVQLWWGTGWLDYDPTLPDSTPGSALATPTGTTTEIPAELVHEVTLRVVATNLEYGSYLQERVVLERTFQALDVADRRVFLYFQPELEGIGGGIVRVLTGIAGWTPVLLVDGESTKGWVFEAGGRGTDLFGDPTETSPLASLRIEVTRSVPGLPDLTATHPLLDRVPASHEDSDPMTPEDLAPLAEDETGPLALGTITQLLVSTGGASAWWQAARRGIAADFLDHALEDEATADDHPLDDLLYPLAVANASLVLGSEQLAIPALGETDRIRGWIAAPRAYLASLGQDPASGTDLGFGTDLLLDDVRIVGADAAAAADGALAGIWYGALQAALETDQALGRAGGLSDTPGELSGASLAMSQPLQVLTGTAATGVPALREAVDAGSLAVVAGDPARARTWWTVDPATGMTRAVLDPGSGGVNGKIAWGSIRHRPPVVHRGGGGGANTWYLNDDGSITRTPKGTRPPAGGRPTGPPPSRCGGGQEYVTIVGCVSIPAAWAIRIGVGLIVTAVVTDAIIVFAGAL